MTPIDNALAELASSASPNISATARSHGIHPSTLSRRWRGRSTSKKIAPNQQISRSGRAIRKPARVL
jgi:transposase-like protein